ncbi:GPP34 family phosphoprotein [Amycolatopsis sp. NPDC004079]|uniref:GPP34 family phosphoprotein n=1 Tax=Amycolatopsis sp. NPDC004079 TaxID=3154549 RepID=UPI0033A70AD8
MTRSHAGGPAYNGSPRLADLVLVAVYQADPRRPAIRDRDALGAALAVGLLAEQVFQKTIDVTPDEMVWLREPVPGPDPGDVLEVVRGRGLPAPVSAAVAVLAPGSAATVWERLVRRGVAQPVRGLLGHRPGFEFTDLCATQWPRALFNTGLDAPDPTLAPVAVALWRILGCLGLDGFSVPAATAARLGRAASRTSPVDPLLSALPDLAART